MACVEVLLVLFEIGTGNIEIGTVFCRIAIALLYAG